VTAEGWVLIIGAAGSQVVLALQAWKASRAVGSPNGLGTVHEALGTINKKMDVFCERLSTVEKKVL
jgi:hypothetical protein